MPSGVSLAAEWSLSKGGVKNLQHVERDLNTVDLPNFLKRFLSLHAIVECGKVLVDRLDLLNIDYFFCTINIKPNSAIRPFDSRAIFSVKLSVLQPIFCSARKNHCRAVFSMQQAVIVIKMVLFAIFKFFNEGGPRFRMERPVFVSDLHDGSHLMRFFLRGLV